MKDKNDPKVNKLFAANLKYLMDKYQVRNKDLAAILNVKPSAISNYCSGYTPRMEILSQIADLFHVSVDALLNSTLENDTFLEEDSVRKITPFIVPIFGNRLNSVENIFNPENFDDCASYSYPLYGDYKCYTIRICNNDLSSAGITNKNIVTFAFGTKLEKNEIGVILIKSEKRIAVGRISVSGYTLTLSTDKTSETFPYLEGEGDVQILGKVVQATFSPNP